MIKHTYLSQLHRIKHRIILLAWLSLFLTALAVGLAISLPMYHSVKQQIEKVHISNLQAQAHAVENQFTRFESLAEQFTSRSEIRKRLELYVDGEWSLQQVQQYSQPRLEEPANKIPDLAAMFRLGPEDEMISAVGAWVKHIQPMAQKGLAIVCCVTAESEQQTVLIAVTAPIISSKGQLIGHDILYFHTQTLIPLMRDFADYGEQAEILIYSKDTQQVLIFNHELELVQLVDTSLITNAIDLDSEQANATLIAAGKDLSQAWLMAPLNNQAWRMLIKIPDRAFYHAAYHDLSWAFASLAFMLLLGTLLTHYSISPLIKRLIQQTDQIEQNALELRMAANVFEHTQEAIVITDPNMQILRANNGFMHTLGIEELALAKQNLRDFIDQDYTEPSVMNQFNRYDNQKNWQGEIWYQHQQTQHAIPTLQSLTAVRDDQGMLIYLIHIFNDISAHKAAENKMKMLAHLDSLTKLPNRNALMSHLDTTITTCKDQAFTVMFIDLDQFKPVNDHYGHQVGDELLKMVAQRIRQSVRSDDVIGRLGGDEFLMVIESLKDNQDANKIAQKVIDRLSEPFKINGQSIKIGASMGIAHYPQNGETIEQLIKAADQAMYQAKQSGRNRYCEA